MLSQAVMKAAGNQNPVVLAAQILGYTSDTDFLKDAAKTSALGDDVTNPFLEKYESTKHQPNRAIPFFSVSAIHRAFPVALPKKQGREKLAATAEEPKKKKQPPRQCGTMRGR